MTATIDRDPAAASSRARSSSVGRHRRRTTSGPGLRAVFGVKSGDAVRHDLEGLRAIAVLGVVVYHLRSSWLPGGFAGVDVFFVLSGFFITGLVFREIDRTGSVDLMRFWGRRARRLLPASALVIVVTVVAGWVMTNPLEAQRIARDGVFSAIFGMNWRSAVQNTQYLQDPHPSPFVHYWSLGVEEQFYLAWPLVLIALAALWRITRKRTGVFTARRTLLVVAIALAVPSFLLALGQTRNDNSYAYFGTLERVWQLALGGVLAVAIGRLERLPQWARACSRWIGVVLVVAFYLAASTDVLYPGRKSLVPAAGAALIIAAGEPVWRRWDPIARLLCSRPAQIGGRYSYSWYLWHYPPLVLLAIYLDRPLRIRELAYVAIGTFLAAALTYHLLENPIRKNRWLGKPRGGRSLALGAILVVVGLAAGQGMVAFAGYQAARTGITTGTGVRLEPQPAAAAADYPRVYADGCVRGLNDDSTDLPAGNAHAPGCRYLPDTGHGDVILTGDSHAAMWFPAVQKIAQQRGWGLRIWARNSCPTADVTRDIGWMYIVCDGYRMKLMKTIVAAHPSLVIVANLDTITWLYTRDSDGKPTSKGVKGMAARRAYEDGYVRSLSILRRAGIKVLLIHDTPGYPKSMTGPDCVLAHPKDLNACSLAEAAALPPGPDDLTAARRAKGVSTIDFTPVFCRNSRCYQVIDSTLAYRDQNHLTTAMTGRLEPALATVAAAAMNGQVTSALVPADKAR